MLFRHLVSIYTYLVPTYQYLFIGYLTNMGSESCAEQMIWSTYSSICINFLKFHNLEPCTDIVICNGKTLKIDLYLSFRYLHSFYMVKHSLFTIFVLHYCFNWGSNPLIIVIQRYNLNITQYLLLYVYVEHLLR